MSEDNAAASSGVPLESAAVAAVAETKKEEESTTKNDTTKNDTTKNDGASESKPASSGRAKRERKTVKAFNPEEFVEEKKEIEVPDGAGVKIEDMPNVVENLKAITYSDVKMKTLYNLIFGQGKKKDFRKHLMQFNGLVYAEGTEESEREKLREKMYKLTMPQLKGLMDLADINRSADSFGLAEGKNPGKEEHVTRFIEWLEMPVASGKKKGKSSNSGKKRKSSSSGSAKKEKKEKAAPAKKAKSAKKKKAKKVEKEVSSSDDSDSSSDDEEIKLTIAGVDIDKVKAKVRSIVKSSDTDELTVKGVRKKLEEWLDCDLSKDKDAVRAIVMEAM